MINSEVAGSILTDFSRKNKKMGYHVQEPVKLTHLKRVGSARLMDLLDP